LLSVTVLLVIGLVVYALTDSAVALPVVRFLLSFERFGGDLDADLDLDI
jgi:hypothetical protein